MPDIQEFGKKLMPEIRASVIYCSTLPIVCWAQKINVFVSNGKISPQISSSLLKANVQCLLKSTTDSKILPSKRQAAKLGSGISQGRFVPA